MRSTFGISPSGPGPFLVLRDLSCFRIISLSISKTGAVVLLLSTAGVFVSGFSYRVKNVFNSSG